MDDGEEPSAVEGTTSKTLKMTTLSTTPSMDSSSRQLCGKSLSQLPAELSLKYMTQICRIEEIQLILNDIPQNLEKISLIEVEGLMEELEEIHAEFTKEHAYLELNWPAAFISHEYFEENTFETELTLYKRTKVIIKIVLANARLSNIETQKTYSSKTQVPSTSASVPRKFVSQPQEVLTTSESAALPQPSTEPQSTTTINTDGKFQCDYCCELHYIVRCPLFRKLSVPDRCKVVLEKRLCFNCFGRHNVKMCRNTVNCLTCARRHHSMLHDNAYHRTASGSTTKTTSTSLPTEKPTEPTTSPASQCDTGAIAEDSLESKHDPDGKLSTLLPTAMVNITTTASNHKARLLIDSGSEITFVSEDLIRETNVQCQHSSIPIIGIGGNKSVQTCGVASLTLRSIYTKASVTVRAHILKNMMPTILPTFQSPVQMWPHLEKLKLADSDFTTPRKIDILIGSDSYGEIIKPNIIKYSPSMPIAQLSIFGWVVLGPVSPSQALTSPTLHVPVHHQDANLRELLTKFWIQEEVKSDVASVLSPEEQECENYFKSTHTRDSSGRYIVRIPLKSSAASLGTSYATAHHRLQRVLRKFKKNKEYRTMYTTFMEEYKELGHMARASGNGIGTTNYVESDVDDVTGMTLAHEVSTSGGLRVPHGCTSARIHSPVYYLSHHEVLKPDSTTAKTRVVFNGSSSTSSGKSLNDIMHTGTNLMLDITDVLIWIRHHRHIFSTDIAKMYQQIKVHKDDWNLQRILWLDEKFNEIPYHLTTVTDGMRAAPFLAVRALIQLAEDEGQRFPLAVPSIMKGRYVDGIFGGADSARQLKKVAKQLTGLCNAGGFPLAKWHSTSHDLLKAISSKEATNSITFDDCATKILGITWFPRDDEFTFFSRIQDHNGVFTKRIILSEVAKIFDPLGFVSPVVIRAKMLLQKLWLHKISWDDPLPSQIASRWTIIREDFKRLAGLSVPRWFNTYTNSTVEIHGFSGASQLAMAAVVYIVTKSPSTGAKSSLVCSKTKVAPIKTLTATRLELTAALLLTKLVKHIVATIQVKVSAIHLWTDSRVSLTLIKTHPSQWKDFIRNRVTQIQDLTPTGHWRHVPGTSNPAVCASRGVTTQKLKDHPLWWVGPPWIMQPIESWPHQPTESDDLCALEVRPGIAFTAAAPKIDYHWDIMHRYSSLHKLLRITAICFRILSRLKGTLDSSTVTTIPSSDIEKARIFWVKATQAAYFSHELRTLSSNGSLSRNHVFSRLTAFIDHQGVIRVGGRLHVSALNYEEKHPAILPRHSKLSLLIIQQAHLRTLHGGTQLTLANVRHSYWIIGGRAPVKAHILRCMSCARQRGVRAQQLTGQLLFSRIIPSRPFSITGIHYAGPLTIKTWKGRGAKISKGWFCVFVCFATTAVHFETVSDYSTEGFIEAYRRFTSRRGIPVSTYPDCGTNYGGADAALQKILKQAAREHQIIASIPSRAKTHWHYNPPTATYTDGKLEAVVKSIKFHLRRTVGETVLTSEELSTMLSQIEAILNSRPLEPLSDDPDDTSALTPGHFLTGSWYTALPEPSVEDLEVNRLSRRHLIQQKIQRFWTQWTAHYLQWHKAISKWHHPSNELKVGSLVLITDQRLPPTKWPLARVIILHPENDGFNRVATIKTATTTLTRPVTKLAPLLIQLWE